MHERRKNPRPFPDTSRALFSAGAAGSASDGQLLERFRRRGGSPDAEAAFAVLVARHGPMVARSLPAGPCPAQMTPMTRSRPRSSCW